MECPEHGAVKAIKTDVGVACPKCVAGEDRVRRSINTKYNPNICNHCGWYAQSSYSSAPCHAECHNNDKFKGDKCSCAVGQKYNDETSCFCPWCGKVIIVTTFGRSGYLRRALEGGAAGYLLKDAPAEELAEAVRRVHQGLRAVAPELAAQAWGEPDPLTDRERQVLQLAGEGLSNAKIADELHLSVGTVRNYLSEAIGKLGAANRTEAARLARKQGWL